LDRHKHPIIKTHWLDPDYANLAVNHPSIANWLQDKGQVFYIIRHPNDVMASYFLFSKSINPSSCENIGKWLLDASNYWRRHVNKWTARHDVIIIKFEDIINQPRMTLKKVANKLNLKLELKSPILPNHLNSIWHGRLRRLFCTNSPSTEIITKDQGQKFDVLFRDIDLTNYIQNISDLCDHLGYTVQSIAKSDKF